MAAGSGSPGFPPSGRFDWRVTSRDGYQDLNYFRSWAFQGTPLVAYLELRAYWSAIGRLAKTARALPTTLLALRFYRPGIQASTAVTPKLWGPIVPASFWASKGVLGMVIKSSDRALAPLPQPAGKLQTQLAPAWLGRWSTYNCFTERVLSS